MSKSSKKELKQKREEYLKSLVPYFRLKLHEIGGRVVCNLGGYAGENDKLHDEIIESVDDDKQEKIGLYDVGYLTQHCNISGSYIVKNDKLPVFCKNVLYSRQTLLSGNLFTCFLYFTLDEATKNAVTDYSKYYNRVLSGKFTLELMTIDSDFLENFLEHKKNELVQEYMLEVCDEFETTSDNEKDEIVTKMNEKIENRLDIYRKYFEPIDIERPRRSKIIEKMDNLFASPEMKELIEYGLLFRDKKRIAETCPDQTFERPKKVINLKELYELKDNEDNLDARIEEMLANCSDSDADE